MRFDVEKVRELNSSPAYSLNVNMDDLSSAVEQLNVNGVQLDSGVINNGNLNGKGNSSSIFSVEQVQLMFSLTDIVSVVVANNILCMAVKSGKIIRIDLDHPESVDDIDLPKKTSEIGYINAIYLDPTGAHLLITTDMKESLYLHYQSTKAKLLGRLKGLSVSCVAWCPLEFSRSTGEVLIGTQDGSIYEIFLEPSNEYFKREDRYCRQMWKASSGSSQPIIGLFAFQATESDVRKVLAASKRNMWYWEGKVVSRTGGGGSEILPIYTKFFDKIEPVREEFEALDDGAAAFSISPLSSQEKSGDSSKNFQAGRTFAWANSIGFLLGQLGMNSSSNDDKQSFFDSAILFLYDQLPFLVSSAGNSCGSIKAILLTEFHILILQDNIVHAINRISSQLVFSQKIQLDQPEDSIIGLCGDVKFSTYWAYSNSSIFEIRSLDEGSDIWKSFLKMHDYDRALKMANDSYSRDVVSQAYGEYALDKKDYVKAANLLGNCSKPFESVALSLLDTHNYEALQVYLKQKFKRLSTHHLMQKTIISSWMLEIYMERLNLIDNSIAGESENQALQKKSLLAAFKNFVAEYKQELDKDTVYEIISSHNRRDELLYYATSISDHEYVIKYWVRMENWIEALKVLIEQNDDDNNNNKLVYKYSTVLLINAPKPTVDSWMRMSKIEPVRLIPALMTYVSTYRGNNNLNNPKTNQAIRFLTYSIEHLHTTDVVIYNTLISLYASNSTMSEAPLLNLLESLSFGVYDFDFALRICSKFNRVQCSVHIYSVLSQYEEAVRLALSKNNIDLACIIADRPMDNSDLRRSLWLDIAKSMIETDGLKSAIKVLDRCELLRIEDLLVLFPDFSTIDDFKEELLSSMENYNSSINQLNKDIEESIETANSIKGEIKNLSKRHVLIEPGEGCQICRYPLVTRKFYVFPCQHAFHFDCLADEWSGSNDYQLRRRLWEAKASSKNKGSADVLDSILTERCILCGDVTIDNIDKLLVTEPDTAEDIWALS